MGGLLPATATPAAICRAGAAASCAEAGSPMDVTNTIKTAVATFGPETRTMRTQPHQRQCHQGNMPPSLCVRSRWVTTYPSERSCLEGGRDRHGSRVVLD